MTQHLRPRTLTTFSSIVGFYLAFRLVAVVISVRLFDADPQIGVVTSLALNYLMFAVRGFPLIWPWSAQVFLVLSHWEFSLVTRVSDLFRLQSSMDKQCIVIGGNSVLVRDGMRLYYRNYAAAHWLSR